MAKTDGLYYSEPGKLFRRGDFVKAPTQLHSTPFLRAHSDLVGEETYLGMKVFVIRNKHHDGGYTDSYQSPVVGVTPLKLRTLLPAGREATTEMVKLRFVQISDDMIEAADDQASVGHFVAEILSVLEEQGRRDLADQARAIQSKFAYMLGNGARLSSQIQIGLIYGEN